MVIWWISEDNVSLNLSKDFVLTLKVKEVSHIRDTDDGSVRISNCGKSVFN